MRRVRRRWPRHTANGRPGVRAPAEDDQWVPKGAHVGRTGVSDHVRVLPRVQVPGRAQRARPVQGGDLPARMPGPLSGGRPVVAAAEAATPVRANVGQEGPTERAAGLRAVLQHGPAERPGADGPTSPVRQRRPRQAATA